MKNKIIWTITGVLILLWLIWLIRMPAKPGKLDQFATCLKDSGAIFYGTFWCPKCQDQKAMFGSSAKLLPYVECSTPNGKGQLPICQEKKIEGYPTWDFPNNERKLGVQNLSTLSELTSCVLPTQ